MSGPFVTGTGSHADRFHILSYLGEDWCKGAPRSPDEMVSGYTRHVVENGGVITWDVPILESGLIPETFMGQLGAIGEGLAARRFTYDK